MAFSIVLNKHLQETRSDQVTKNVLQLTLKIPSSSTNTKKKIRNVYLYPFKTILSLKDSINASLLFQTRTIKV